MKFQYDGSEQFIFNHQPFFQKKLLGAGAFGKVFLFESKNARSRYAVKCETEQHGRYAFGYYFEREANWYEKIYGTGFLAGDPDSDKKPHYILMPYFEGKSLYGVSYPTLKHVVFNWVWSAAAIDTLHTQHHAVHCDIKTDNFVVGETIRLIDFGLTTETGCHRPIRFHEYDASCLYHQAPELFSENAKRKRAEPAQDIYSLGVLLCDLCIFFISSENNGNIQKEQRKKIDEVIRNLCADDPKARWSIAKGIYLLVAGYLTPISRTIWDDFSEKNFSKHTGNVTTRMPSMCRKIIRSGIQVRLSELEMEQKQLHAEKKHDDTKQQKIIGLRGLQITLRESTIATLDIVHAAKEDGLLTAGLFRHKTKDVLNELYEVACGFHQLH